MAIRSPPRLAWLALLLSVVVNLAGCSAAKVNGTNSIPDPELTKIFPQLSEVDTPLSWAPSLGGQNFTTCCLKAINEALAVTENGTLVFASETYSSWIIFNNDTTPLDALKQFNMQGQFPCTAVYNGNSDGAPMLEVPYQWLNDTCPGWQISSKDNLNAWLQPLSGFLIPAIIFCISVPRRRKLELPKILFSSDQSGVQGYFLMVFGAPVALALVAADTLIWLCICFAFAGPMIVSGLYEAVLDNRVIEFVKGKINEKQLTLDMRCRCLMLVLIGNLDLVWRTEDGGHIDGGGPAVVGMDDQEGQGLLQQDGQNYPVDNSDGQDEQSVYSMDNITRVVPYQQVTTGPPSSASVSPGSPAPVLPHSPIDTAYDTPPQPPPISSLASGQHSSSSQTWAQPSVGQRRPSVPSLSFHRVSTASLTPQQSHAAPADFDSSNMAGFPPVIPAPSHTVSPSQTPPAQRLVLPDQASASAPPNNAPGLVSANFIASSITPGAGRQESHTVSTGEQSSELPASPWQHMEQFLYGLRLYPDEIKGRDHSPRQNPNPCTGCDSCFVNGDVYSRTCTAVDKELFYRSPKTTSLIHQIKTRLKTMLHCQYSFGSVIGAPVVFFLGGFIFALLQSLDTLGDEDIAEGLAFGQWYMTIPHIAIISGLLLAGNNPSILEGVLALDGRTYPADERRFLFFNYGLAYPSCYKVASLWDRGHNKRMWLETLINTYLINQAGVKDKDIEDLKSRITLPFMNWIFLLFLAFLLLGVPFILAFLTAFYTPEIGLSCRSLTFSIYFCVQTMQIVLWMWAYAGPLTRPESESDKEKREWFGAGGRLARHDFYKPYSMHWLFEGGPVPRSPSKIIKHIYHHPRRLLSLGFLWNVVYYPFQYFLGLVGIMAAIGGTLMQLMGVYTADICYVTTEYWFLPFSQRSPALLSSNSAEMIENAEKFWEPCAIAGIAFMSVVSFIGWWYQRRMRDIFAEQVLRIDDVAFEREKDTRISRLRGGPRSSTAFSGRHVSSSANIYPPAYGVQQFSISSNPGAPDVAPSTAGRVHSMPVIPSFDNGGLGHTSGSRVPNAYGSQPDVSGRRYNLVRTPNSMPAILSSRARTSMPTNAGVPTTGYPPATEPLSSGVWNQGMPSPPQVGQPVVVCPDRMSSPGPASNRVRFLSAPVQFTDPHGDVGQMGGTGLGVYGPLSSQDAGSEEAYHRPHRQSMSSDQYYS